MKTINKREFSIDFLKCLCMLGVIIIHLTGQGGLLSKAINNVWTFNFYLIINNILRICLNIFCIITGYLYVLKKEIKSINILKIVIDLLFYSFIIVIIFYSFNLFDVRKLGTMYMTNSLFPSMIGRYWYITCYFFLFFMIPYINLFIKKISKSNFKKLLLIVFVLLCILPELFCYDYFRILNGYSPFWLMYLYMIGAYIKLYGINLTKNRKILFVLLCLLVNISLIVFTNNFLNSSNLFYHLGEYFVSPFLTILSVLVFDLVRNIQMKNNLLAKLGKYSLAVYIIHCHRLIYDWIIGNRMIFVKSYNFLVELLIILGIAIGIYIVCVVIEIIKKKIFVISKIDNLIEKVSYKLDEVLS